MLGSVLRQLPANRDMDLFLGAVKATKGYRTPFVISIDIGQRADLPFALSIVLPRRIVRQEEFVIWKYRAASDLHFVENGRKNEGRMKEEEVKKRRRIRKRKSC